jgi:hypothetical protein
VPEKIIKIKPKTNRRDREVKFKQKTKARIKIKACCRDMEQEEQETPTPRSPRTPRASSTAYSLVLAIMSKRRTWVCLFVIVYAILLSSSWNWLKTILSWYKQQESQSSASGWPALYASVLLGAVFGLLSMVAALAVAVPATLVIWITVVVMLTFFGKPRRVLVVEGRKITKEIIGFVFKTLLKEGNAVAAVCAVLGYFVIFRRNCEVD